MEYRKQRVQIYMQPEAKPCTLEMGGEAQTNVRSRSSFEVIKIFN